MRIAWFFLASFWSFWAQAKSETFGHHGMVIFGNDDGLFASHLPMFHAPHHYQLVLAIELSDSVQHRDLLHALHHKPELWTIDPEAFALSELWLGSRQRFVAKLYRGHFERGGTMVAPVVEILVKNVVMKRRLKRELHVAQIANYLMLGSGSQPYLIKKLDARPDYDHIIQLELCAGAVQSAKLALPFARLKPNDHALTEQLRLLGLCLDSAKTLYFETSDLQ
jgi:hypothetical protein